MTTLNRLSIVQMIVKPLNAAGNNPKMVQLIVLHLHSQYDCYNETRSYFDKYFATYITYNRHKV